VRRAASAASFRAAPERTSRGLLARRARDGDHDPSAASFRAAPERTSRAAPPARRRPRSRRSPIAELWNLGASKNWLRAEALAAGDPELIELSEDLSSALQLTDQYVYDNNFIYFQPGNGKLKYKEPKDQVKVAQSKLKQIIAAL